MANKVAQFLSDSGGNNFTETAPRPPVPGEENELQSTHSSGSQRSHHSNKSITSNKSTKSVSSVRDNGPSPAATPRRSNLDKCLSMGASEKGDDDAPLGFEPEGSASNSPHFTEESSTPSYLKWALSLDYLLNDANGVDLFKDFLEQEIGTLPTLNFWFACEGLKQKSPTDSEIPKVIKGIHRRFIRGDQLTCISAEVRGEILEKINRKDYSDQGMFDLAQTEVKCYMKNTTYPLFINSDLYVQYIQNGGKSPKTSNSSSGSNSVRPVSGPLPTLPEDCELQSEDVSLNSCGGNLGNSYLSDSSVCNTSRVSKSSRKNESLSMSACTPYHSHGRRMNQPLDVSSYVPVSAQDSELQSLSSGALTDDTVSLTDSSISDMPTMPRDRRHFRQQRKLMQRRAEQNRESREGYQSFIPRTDRAPKDRNLAETDPVKFFELLKERMEYVVAERQKEELAELKLKEKLRVCESDCSEERVAALNSSRNTTATSILQAIKSSMIEDDNPQSILEDHCSRVWSSSSQQTPSRSPGRHSPRNKSPERTRKGQAVLAPLSTSHVKGHKKKDRDKLHASLLDRGAEDGKPSIYCGTETHKHIHHHHYHHHGSKMRKEIEAQMCCYSLECDRGRNTKRSNKKTSDAGRYLDSGISMISDHDSLPPKPNLAAVNSDKVLQWIMDQETKVPSSQSHQDSSKSSSHKSRTHTTGSGSQQSHKQSTSKKPTSSGRSSSVDRPGMMTQWSGGNSGQVMPAQPMMQDSSMPLLPPPNTTVSLEEARRRLEDQARSAPVKSKSFTGTISKDKAAPPNSLSTSQIRTLPSTKTCPVLDSSTSTSEKKSTKKPSSSVPTTPNTSTSQDETVIGYYFCGEPIPYKHTVAGKNITLNHFKQIISKRGTFRYFFKKACPEFDGVVYEEITEDNTVLPLFEGIIVAKVDRIDGNS